MAHFGCALTIGLELFITLVGQACAPVVESAQPSTPLGQSGLKPEVSPSPMTSASPNQDQALYSFAPLCLSKGKPQVVFTSKITAKLYVSLAALDPNPPGRVENYLATASFDREVREGEVITLGFSEEDLKKISQSRAFVLRVQHPAGSERQTLLLCE